MITSVIPKLPFVEKQKTLDFYLKLGGTLDSDYGDYLIVSLEQIELHFFPFPDMKPETSDFMIYIRIETGIETYYQKFQDSGIAIHPNGKLEKKPWNQMEFAIIDPCGTLLTFGQSI